MTLSRELADPGEATGRQRITDAAAELFLRNGYAQTSLRDIADAAGIKAGSIYYHFDSKESLFRTVLERGITVMEDAFDAAADESRGLPSGERIRAHVRGHLSALFDHGPYTANHVSAFHIAPQAVRDAVIPARDRYEEQWVRLFAELRASGEMDASVPEGLARLALFGAMNFAVEWFDPRRGNLDELVEVIARQFWNGVAA
jgi:TetR/AcrR family transcriptional regulator, cholesterol catabolism regulator